jgi:hypothetical protein
MISSSSTNLAAVARGLGTASIEYFAIQLSPAADGRFFVGIEATICECEGELSQMELGHHRVASLADALAAIRHAVAPATDLTEV